MLRNYKDWYGLFKNGELILVKSFEREPSVMDFKTAYFSDNDYEVRELKINW